MRILEPRSVIPILLTVVMGCAAPMPAVSANGAPMAPGATLESAPPPPPPPPAPAAGTAGLSSDFSAHVGLGAKQAPIVTKSNAPAPQQPPQQQGAGQPVQRQQSIIVYSAEINMTVFEVENSMKRIEDLAKTIGGFMAKREDKTIVIRVPADKFEETLHAIEKIGDVSHRNIIAEDVTEEFRDLEVRLKGSKAVQERLTQLLAKASKVEESIAIERELDRVTMEIDRIEGRMKFLRDRAAFSTLTITFQPKATENVQKNGFQLPTPWLSELGLGRLLKL
jgi:hypothetical protein